MRWRQIWIFLEDMANFIKYLDKQENYQKFT